MKLSHADTPLPQMTQPSINPSRLVLLVLIFALVGFVLVRNFGHDEEQREMLQWQNTLGLVADSRTADVESWAGNNFHELSGVAANPSLQLYVTVLESPKPASAKTPDMAQGNAPEDPAQAVFLRNLLLLTADRLGFLTAATDPLKAIHANVHAPSGTGLAIVDNSGKILVSTEGLPVLENALAAKVAKAPRGTPSLIDIFTSSSGAVQIGFVLPVYPIQGDATASQQIATLVGVKNVGDDLFRLLAHPGVTDKSLEAILVRRDGDNVQYLSPAPDAKPLSQQFALSTPLLDAAFAIAHPGTFGLMRDRQGRPVLMTSRPVSGTPWVLLLHIDRDVALASSDAHLATLEWIMTLVLVAFVISLIAVWWYGTSRRALLLSSETARLAAQSRAQERLLRLVTDNQPEPIFIADAHHVVRFANERARRMFGGEAALGKDLGALLGAATAENYIEGDTQALETRVPQERTVRQQGEQGERIIRSEHIPLVHIPVDGLPEPSPGVLVIDHDVTVIVRERERREHNLAQLIQTLVRMVDARDPFAANHSTSVALVARGVADEMALEPRLAETAETAGRLMNIGKIVIPSEVLTKTSALGEGEVQAIRDSLIHSADLLQDIDFDGPVVDTLRQVAERWDGSGPLKLEGEAILITARIVAVANAFVGMISTRAFRAAMKLEDATKLLLSQMDAQFDRRVVAALVNFVENRRGRELLADIAKRHA